jgi:hypothetical protein
MAAYGENLMATDNDTDRRALRFSLRRGAELGRAGTRGPR